MGRQEYLEPHNMPNASNVRTQTSGEASWITQASWLTAPWFPVLHNQKLLQSHPSLLHDDILTGSLYENI
jgi:hypothetical protein